MSEKHVSAGIDEWKLLGIDDTHPEWADPVSVDVCWSHVLKTKRFGICEVSNIGESDEGTFGSVTGQRGCWKKLFF